MDKKIKIIILEDNSSDLDLISYELKKLKYPFTAAKSKNKREYLELFKDGLPDIVLSDFNLPDMDGEDALNILREKDQQIPFILVSALIGEEKAVDMMRNGANDYVMKDKLKKLVPTIERELKAYETLKQAEKEHNEVLLYSKIFLNSTDAVCILDENGNIISGNNAVNILAGSNIENFIGKTPAIFFGDKNFDINFKLAKKKGIISRQEKFKNALGEIKTIDLTLLEINDSSGNKRYACIKHDITELEKKKDEISGQKDFYESILENITNGVWVTDKDDRVIYVNSEMLNIAGVPKNKIIGRTIHEGLDDETAKEFKNNYLKVRNTLFPSEYEAKEKTFSDKDTVQRGWLIPYIKENKFDGMICTAEDVTEKVNIQRKLEKANSIINHSSSVAFRWSRNATRDVEYVSENVKTVFGYSSEDFINKKITYSNFIYKEDLEYAKQESKKNFEDDSINKFTHTDYRVVTKYGKIRWVQDNTYIVRDKDGKILYSEGIITDITEKVNFQLKLDEQKRQLDTLVSNLPGMAYRSIADDNWTMTYVSEGVKELTGYSSDELVNNAAISYNDIIDIDEAEKDWSSIYEAMDAGDHYEIEYKIITKEGKKKWVLEKSVPVGKDENGNYITEGFITDINERKEAEQKLLESGSKLKKGEQIAKFGYWQIDLNDNSVELSDGARTIFELEGVLVDLSLMRKLPMEEHRIPNTIAFNDLIKEGKPYEVEYQIQCIKTAQYKFVRSIAEFNKENNLVFGVVNDITERKLLELDLLANQQKFYILYNNAPEMYASVGTESAEIIECNDTLLRITGYKRNEVIGKNIFEIYHKDSVEEAKAIREEYLSSGRIQNRHLLLKKKNGSKLHVNLNVESVKDGSGKIIYSISSWNDITDLIAYDIALKERAELLLKQKEELERSNKELEQFAYIASHDLQEPLRTIASFTQLLETKYYDSLNDEAKSYVDFAVEGSKRMQDLIKGLLEYSRVTSKGDTFQDINLGSSLETVKNNLKSLISESGSEILSDKLPVVHIDPVQMSLVFQNLIQNAVKFRNAGEKVKIHIRSNFIKDKNEWEITVEDNGIGINERYFEKIFTIFHRLHTQKKYPGTGIGLSVCQRIIERHGGKIRVESDGKDKGSRFIFTLPQIKEKADL